MVEANKEYEVESKEEVRKIGKGNTVEVFFRIWATSAKGTYFHVDVPEAALPQAHAFLNARAKELDAI